MCWNKEEEDPSSSKREKGDFFRCKFTQKKKEKRVSLRRDLRPAKQTIESKRTVIDRGEGNILFILVSQIREEETRIPKEYVAPFNALRIFVWIESYESGYIEADR